MALINSYICYCNIIWSSPHKTSNLDKILKIRKKIVELLPSQNSQRRLAHYFKNCISFQSMTLINTNCLSIYIKTINKLIPISVHYYAINASVHDHDTRQRSNLSLPYCRTRNKQKTITYQGAVQLLRNAPGGSAECDTLWQGEGGGRPSGYVTPKIFYMYNIIL